MRPGTVTLIGRGQVHVFERARRLSGAVVRFGPEMLHEGAGLAGRRARVAHRAASRRRRCRRSRPRSRRSRPRPRARSTPAALDLQRHLLSVLLLWVERWYDATRTERRDPDDADVQLYRRFDQALERDFARHHDAAHYADALAVPPAQLSRALRHVTGRTTKQLITDRVMLEAARLLRFTDLTVGEIAFRAGFEDQLYFSRAFKRHYGEAPSAYRG